MDELQLKSEHLFFRNRWQLQHLQVCHRPDPQCTGKTGCFSTPRATSEGEFPSEPLFVSYPSVSLSASTERGSVANV